MSAPLDVRELRKQFSTGRAAVDGVSFHVPAGEIVVLLGPSGCGKTTTLRCVAGLEHPSGGSIAIGGRTVSSPSERILLPPRLRDIGMVFQSYAVWPHMTVRQNVVYPLKHRNIRKAEAERMVSGVLEIVGLSEYADRPVVALSGGQMQRVALARSIVYRPQLLLLDEPLSNLDAKLRLRLREDLRRILKQTGMTALYVTHDQAEAVVLGDRIGVMRDGKLLQMATPEEIYNRPVDLFVASFTGTTNLVSGHVVDRDGEFGTILLEKGYRLVAWLSSGIAVGKRVKVAMRPENIRFGEVDGVVNRFSAEVTARHFEGVQTLYELTTVIGALKAFDLGTNMRYTIQSIVDIVLPAALCWAYPDNDAPHEDELLYETPREFNMTARVA